MNTVVGNQAVTAQMRYMLVADYPRVAEIYRHYVLHGTSTFELEPPDAEEIGRRHKEVLALGLPWIVAEVDHTIAGYGYAGTYRARPAFRFAVEDSVYLDPAFLRRGIGREILLRMIDESTRVGYRQMVAVIGGSDNLGSMGLHRALGFRDVGVLKDVGLKFGRWLDSVIMQRTLGEGAESIPERIPPPAQL